MSDERFFKQMKNVLHDYQPAVDASVYSGMRRKLWWSNFTKLSFHRFNMYYLLVLLLGASAAVILCNNSATAERANKHQFEVVNDLQTPSMAITGELNAIDAASQHSESATCSALQPSSRRNANSSPSASASSSSNTDIQNAQSSSASEVESNSVVHSTEVAGQSENVGVESTPTESSNLTEKNAEVNDPHLGQKAWKVTVKRDGEKPKKKKEN
jgi:hypothetical protein